MSLKGKKLRLFAFAFLNAAVILAVCAFVSGFTRTESGILIDDPVVTYGNFWPWAAGAVACGIVGVIALFRARKQHVE